MDVYEYPEPAPGQPDGPEPAASGSSSTRSTLLKGGGLLLAGLVAGAIGVAALHGSSTPALAASGGPSVGGAPFDRGASGGRGGVDGEQHVLGTLSAVSSTSVTVTGRQGTTTTVPVNADTQVLRDGAKAALSSLKVGEAVLVHVLPSGSGTVAEKILVGTLQGPGGNGRPDGGGFGPPPGDGDGADAGRPPGQSGQSGQSGVQPGAPSAGGSGTTTGGTSTNT